MVFDNIFGFAKNSAGLFSVKAEDVEPQLSADLDVFEGAKDDTYDDKRTDLLPKAIHGASSRAKVVQEQSPEARLILGFLGSFIETTQTSATTQAQHTHAGSVSDAASAGMNQASATVQDLNGLKKDEDLEDRPKKSDFTKPPKTPASPKASEPPKAPKATAENPPKSQ